MQPKIAAISREKDAFGGHRGLPARGQWSRAYAANPQDNGADFGNYQGGGGGAAGGSVLRAFGHARHRSAIGRRYRRGIYRVGLD